MPTIDHIYELRYRREMSEIARALGLDPGKVAEDDALTAILDAISKCVARAAQRDEMRKTKAEALREAADGIDLAEIAEEWGQGPGNRDDMHWAAGNAASSVVLALYDRAAEYEREPERGVGR